MTIPCDAHGNQHDCEEAGCYWWSDNTCHSTAEAPTPPTASYTGGEQVGSTNSGTSWTSDTSVDTYFKIYGDSAAVPGPPRETYISGYLPRYQKRQIVGYHSTSGDLRSVEVNASGHLLIDVEVVYSSGIHVEISGTPVTISGDHVYVESGVYVLVSGQQTARSGHGAMYPYNPNQEDGDIDPSTYCETVVPLTYGYDFEGGSWDRINETNHRLHVNVQSGADVITRLHGYHHASGIWVPLAVTLSGCLATMNCLSGGLF